MDKKTGKIIMYIVVIMLVLYVVYLMYKGSQTKLKEGCFVFEETHPTTDDTADWICLHPDSRPTAGETPFPIGGSLTISNTTASLDGTYEVLGEWVDTSGRQACMKVQHNYTYNFTGDTQGGDPRDTTFYGIGEVCPA
jgi:hypothetical protein